MPASPAERQNTQALVLVRAMVNAAKSDGRITEDEQRAILARLDNPTQDTIQFLREEFGRPLDVREFTWSVPVGMEQQVYSISVITIDADSQSEEPVSAGPGSRPAPDAGHLPPDRRADRRGRRPLIESR